MGLIRTGLRSDKRITELMGTLVAMQYIGMAENITSKVPNDNGEGFRQITQPVVRARVIAFNPDGSNPVELGETLVFPQLLARSLKDRPSDWHAGVLTEEEQRSDSSRSVIVLNPPKDDAEAAFDRVEASLRERALL